MKLRAIAIDDEPVALDILRQHALDIPFLQLSACFISCSEGVAYADTHKPDLVFLDINMPDRSGIALAQLLRDRMQVVFTTAYTDYAIQAFDLAVTDYLLKPISSERFKTACSRALEQLQATTKERYIFVKSGYEQVRINLNELVYIKAADNYAVFYEGGRQVISRTTLGEIAEKLPETDFCRVHKSFIISIAKIEGFTGDQVLMQGISIPVAKSYRKRVEEVLRGTL